MKVVSITFYDGGQRMHPDVEATFQDGRFFCLKIGNKVLRYNMDCVFLVEEFSAK